MCLRHGANVESQSDLMAVHVDLVGALYQPAYCQVAPPTGYCPKRESVRDRQSMWGSVGDTSRKLERLSFYQHSHQPGRPGRGTPQVKRALRKVTLI
jgi:hypothetical protein